MTRFAARQQAVAVGIRAPQVPGECTFAPILIGAPARTCAQLVRRQRAVPVAVDVVEPRR